MIRDIQSYDQSSTIPNKWFYPFQAAATAALITMATSGLPASTTLPTSRTSLFVNLEDIDLDLTIIFAPERLDIIDVDGVLVHTRHKDNNSLSLPMALGNPKSATLPEQFAPTTQINWTPRFIAGQASNSIADATQGYELRNRREILQFLGANTHLLSMLIEARQQIANYFPGSSLALEVTTDPEALDTEQLIAIIITSVSADEAFERLEQLDRGWWLGVIRQAQGKLSISVEFA